MKRLYGFTAVILGLIIIGTITAPRIIGGNSYDIGNSFAPISRIIQTDKEVYRLEETVETSFKLVNNGKQPIYIKPTDRHEVSVNSVNSGMELVVLVDNRHNNQYPMEIQPSQNRSALSYGFKPQYPGDFIIKWMGVKKTVKVEGYKELTLKSPGISLDVITNQTTVKTGDRLDVFLVIRNDNPYPVKVPVFEQFERSGAPINKQRSGLMVGWINSHFKVEANSYEIAWHDRRHLRSPNFAMFYMADGCKADIQLLVTDEEIQLFDPVWVSADSEGMTLFLEQSEGDNPKILVQLRNDNPYPVRIKPFSKIRINHKSLNSSRYTEAQVDFFKPFWDIPAHSTRTIYNTDAYASPTRTPIYYTLYNQVLRYPPEITP